jgi:1-deoxy-D-xylulose-5-phosphate synthase
LRFRSLTLPDRFIEHDSPERQCVDAGIDDAAIVAASLRTLDAEQGGRPRFA